MTSGDSIQGLWNEILSYLFTAYNDIRNPYRITVLFRNLSTIMTQMGQLISQYCCGKHRHLNLTTPDLNPPSVTIENSINERRKRKKYVIS